MNDITPNELKERLDKGEKLFIIDVREPYEYEEYNIGAVLVPLGDLQSRIDEFEDWMNEEVIVHCKSGGRSAAAKSFMIQYGFKNVRNLIGGAMACQALGM
ncbi:MAG: rhodanese-like domain-containing protein [Bacteroidia bacterium]|nr:rhodanese-like domain-containing protein [Bacteroidia bacterium]